MTGSDGDQLRSSDLVAGAVDLGTERGHIAMALTLQFHHGLIGEHRDLSDASFLRGEVDADAPHQAVEVRVTLGERGPD